MKEQTGQVVFGKAADGENMARKTTLVVFGAKDYEEQLARKIAEQAGCTIATATCDGLPVHAENAYRADGFRLDSGSTMLPEKVIFFECSGRILPSPWAKNLPQVICDHHNPGDPGYSRPASEYVLGSSLGQMCYELGLYDELPSLNKEYDLLMVMAGDHCPADAYAGRCPGIDPVEFYSFRIKQKAEFLWGKMDYEEMINAVSVDNLCKVIREEIEETADIINFGECVNGVADLRKHGMTPELPEAALRAGKAYMAKIPELGGGRQPTGKDKIVLGGHTTPRQVESFMAWAKTLVNRVGEPYGNPTRGYAGVVVTRPWCPTCNAEWVCANIGSCPECGTVYPDESLVG